MNSFSLTHTVLLKKCCNKCAGYELDEYQQNRRDELSDEMSLFVNPLLICSFYYY
jgi:hypothetical protein